MKSNESQGWSCFFGLGVVYLNVGNSADVKHEKMKNPELFHRTVGILVKAYLNDTLKSANCASCAVGNIVSVSCGYQVARDSKGSLGWWANEKEEWVDPRWQKVFMTSAFKVFNIRFFASQSKKLKKFKKKARKQIESTGYTLDELALIEKTFERRSIRSDFRGLMAVVDCLQIIHEATETESQRAKELFTLTE